jgi:flagellar motor switch protein FliM
MEPPMSSQDILAQDESDALLNNVQNTVPAAEPPADPGGRRGYDLGHSALFGRVTLKLSDAPSDGSKSL